MDCTIIFGVETARKAAIYKASPLGLVLQNAAFSGRQIQDAAFSGS